MTSKPMTSESQILSEADEIAALLPWYVSGKISEADRARVEAYASAHPEVLGHIALARDEADIVFAENAAIAPPRAALDRLHASVAATPRARLHAVEATLIERIGDWIRALAPKQLAYAGLAGAVLLELKAEKIGSMLSMPSLSFTREAVLRR